MVEYFGIYAHNIESPVAFGQNRYTVAEYLRDESVLSDGRAGASEEFTLSADTRRSV